MMLDPEERVAAALGDGIEVARKRMSLTSAEEDSLRRVEHMIAALEALNLHLQHVEAEAHQFAKRACLDRPEMGLSAA